MTEDDTLRWMRDLINDTAIARIRPGEKPMKRKNAEGFSTWQFYLQRALLNPRFLAAASELFVTRHLLTAKEPFQVAGVMSGAATLVAGIGLEAHRRGLQLNTFMIRKDPKEYGLENVLEGTPLDLPVFLVDDLTSPNHHTMLKGLWALKTHQLRHTNQIFVIVDKRPRGAGNMQSIRHDFDGKVHGLFCLDDFDLTWRSYDATRRKKLEVMSRQT